MPDSDSDGINDTDEEKTYFTDKQNPDTDGDGFNDWVELNKGFSPYNPAKGIKLDKSDADKDGLSDKLELSFQVNPLNRDTDGDGYSDGEEVKRGFDPSVAGAKLDKRIEVNLKKQQLSYFLGTVKLGEFVISSGKPALPTPTGQFKIINKVPRAWSKAYGLWMPYWMGLGSGRFGFHELPEWPNGYKEGANHLGHPVSHGCVRLGVGPAKTLYDWVEVGTPVVIR